MHCNKVFNTRICLRALAVSLLTGLAVLGYLVKNTTLISTWSYQAKEEDSRVWTTQSAGTDWTLKELWTNFKNILNQPCDSPVANFSQTCGKEASACTRDCIRPLSNNTEKRLNDVITSPNLTLSKQQRDAILSLSESIPESDVIFLSASSSNHYDEMQAMFHNLHTVVFPLIPNITVVLFDIGLTEDQRRKTELHCRCHVVRFPAEKFPPHMKTNICYSWKPVIVRATMDKVRQILVYQDASIRWDQQLLAVINRTRTFGLQFHRNDYLSRISLHTLKQTFNYFGEEPCAFSPFPELEANNGIYKKDPFVIRGLLEPWARCALEASCMCPVDPGSVLSCNKPVAEHRCHRFDQSALGMITAKLFNKDINRIFAPSYKYLDIRRDHRMANYFNSLDKPKV
ncbi:unnamed protein product [Lymnaea stagnalis]|uniref:Uncharacterized protein n=1 Tax=Lymnaea stagnalis TaxID=6523 RepID=A0AAV2HTP2_LYMST